MVGHAPPGPLDTEGMGAGRKLWVLLQGRIKQEHVSFTPTAGLLVMVLCAC